MTEKTSDLEQEFRDRINNSPPNPGIDRIVQLEREVRHLRHELSLNQPSPPREIIGSPAISTTSSNLPQIAKPQ